MPSVIALDAMGSERAPKPEIEGAIQAARQQQNDRIRQGMGVPGMTQGGGRGGGAPRGR